MVHAEREGGKAEGTGVDSGQVRSGIPARTAVAHTAEEGLGDPRSWGLCSIDLHYFIDPMN